MRRLPATGWWWKRWLPVAGQGQGGGNQREAKHGGPGRAESRFAVQEGAEAKNQKDHEEREEEVTGKTCKDPEVGREGGGAGHGAEGTSCAFTLVLVVPLAVCALGAGTAGWKHIAVAGGYWCALFVISYWVVRRWGSGITGPVQVLFVESRMAIGLIGIAAVTFRSPVLLEVVPDILAVSIAAAGCMDGLVVADSRRLQACARNGVSDVGAGEERQ